MASGSKILYQKSLVELHRHTSFWKVRINNDSYYSWQETMNKHTGYTSGQAGACARKNNFSPPVAHGSYFGWTPGRSLLRGPKGPRHGAGVFQAQGGTASEGWRENSITKEC
jgi:hypothetical protein